MCKCFTFIEKSSSSATPQFTAAEIALYKKHLEEGYDITTDAKYNAWVKLQDTTASKYAAYIAIHVQLHAIACCDFKRKLGIYLHTTYLVLEPKDH